MNTYTNDHSALDKSADKAKEMASDLSDTARETASEFTDRAEDQIRETAMQAARQQRTAASNYVASLGRAAEAAVNSLERDGCKQTAERLAPLSSFLADSGASISAYDVRAMVEDATSVAKRNPAVTFGLAALAGYALVKLAGSGKRDNDQQDYYSQGGPRYHD